MLSKRKADVIASITIFFLVINAISGLYYICIYVPKIIHSWHMSYYAKEGYPLTTTIYLEKKEYNKLKPKVRFLRYS